MVFSDFLSVLKQKGLEAIGRYYSIYYGFVEDCNDPKKSGRLQLVIPDITGTKPLPIWASSLGIHSSNEHGYYGLPKKGDRVWVQFRNGDPSFPVWSYAHYDETERYSPIFQQNYNDVAGIKSRFSYLKFDDTDETVILRSLKTNYGIEVNSNGVSIVADNISLGSLNSSSQTAVLGDNLFDKLGELINTVKDLGNQVETIMNAVITESTANAVQVPLLAPANQVIVQSFVPVYTSLSTMDTNLSVLYQTLSEIKSQRVTLE
jgi:hypothetical protein